MSKSFKRNLVSVAVAVGLGGGLLSTASASPVTVQTSDAAEQCSVTVLEKRMASPTLKGVFGTAFIEAFSVSGLGSAWAAGQTVRENVLTPADITGLEKDADRVATLALWPGMESLPEATTSVNEFYAETRSSLNKLGRATFSDYDAEAPHASKSLEVHELLLGTDSVESAVRNYDEAYRRFYHLKKAVVSAGYPDAEWGSKEIELGEFDESATDWESFTSAYSSLSLASTNLSALPAPTFDFAHRVVAPDSSSSAPREYAWGSCYE